MGLLNIRARCPKCGGLIHTQPTALGSLTWMRNGPLLVTTGKECQWCGVALTGKVDWQNRAILADDPDQGTAKRVPKRIRQEQKNNDDGRRSKGGRQSRSTKKPVTARQLKRKRNRDGRRTDREYERHSNAVELSPQAERILGAICAYSSSRGLCIFPDIPSSKVANASKSCGVPADEILLALIDCTFVGTASDALVFAERGFYYHNDAGNLPDPGIIAYSELPQIAIGTDGSNRITFGCGRYCNKVGSAVGLDRIIVILETIQEVVRKELKGSSAVSITEPDFSRDEEWNGANSQQRENKSDVPRDLGRLENQIVGALQRYGNEVGFYIAPGIPKLKANNAKNSCAVPADDDILGLVDCTIFGSASDALVFGRRAFYYHNGGGNVPDPGLVPYDEFPSISFGTAWLNCITLGGDRYCNKAGSKVTRDKIIAVLNAIKAIWKRAR